MKLKTNLSIKSQLQTYKDRQFTQMQIEQIRLGLESGLDVNKYAIIKFNGVVMIMIRELMELDADNVIDFSIDKFISGGALSIEYLLEYHKGLAYRYNSLTRFSEDTRKYVLSNVPYYVN